MGPVFGKEAQQRLGVSASTAKIIGAVGAGVIAATCSHPMDTIKTCMQGDIERKTYQSLTHTASTLYNSGGLGSFFRGWGWRTSRMICAVFIMNECKVQLSPLLFPQHFERLPQQP
eukprot:m.227565 g.227565  ORF g.227565 m.227565 type:complete len:116 (-) comp18817_c0_seq6:337-684(-)